MSAEVRFAGRIRSVTIAHHADAWYASFAIEVPYEPDLRTDDAVVGVDLGISALATLSDGSDPIRAPKPLQGYLGKLKRLSRALSRKQRGSNNRAKAKIKLARLHRRIADIRADALHKLTTSLTRYRTIVIEDLNVAGMLANRHLSRAIADLGLFEFRRQLTRLRWPARRSSLLIAGIRARSSARRAARRTRRSRSRTEPGRAHRAAPSTTATSTRRATPHDTRRVGPGQPVERTALAVRGTSP